METPLGMVLKAFFWGDLRCHSGEMRFNWNLRRIQLKYKALREPKMIINVVTVYVKTEKISEFISATLKNHLGTRQEPGNRRFDVLQSQDDPSRFTLYEAFLSTEAVDAHRQTPHYIEWKTKVEAWMTKPREGRWHSILAPTDNGAW